MSVYTENGKFSLMLRMVPDITLLLYVFQIENIHK